jgi:diaminopropionate ammonia-lyase
MAGQFFINLAARNDNDCRGLFGRDEYHAVCEFYRRRADLKPTPLHSLQQLAAELGLKDILLKDESVRFGTDAFKIAGVTYAMDHLLLEKRLAKDSVVVCATEGNHGKAVARVGASLGLRVKVYVSDTITAERVVTLEREGAEVVTVNGTYDDAVRRAAEDATRAGWIIVSDTAWPGYEEIPRLIMAGYTRLLDESELEWGPEPPGVVLVQAGVGGLAGAVVSWLCWKYGSRRPFTIICEPTSAASYLASARAGIKVSAAGPINTIMSGLRCDEMSSIAFPVISRAADAFIAVDDEHCIAAMRTLARPRFEDAHVTAGPAGACGVAALLLMCQNDRFEDVRKASGLDQQSRVFVINTEGATDKQLYQTIVSN